ncbi:PIN domain-containing protein [Microlunatus parietis]|uniref:Putative nucleic acid-binding protein n=1 Tax=Microlunatus parietis TaxID=682979 RepID=A0A7Y9I8P6_9ACTN|nr:PIN domain-containing protein [Microlunatus parietis]NYE72262.1 putative nucleic acid-binding protein [Microlunatus parietis]
MADELVLVDTDVWSRVILGRRDQSAEVATWRRLLVGRQPVIAAQTEAELRFLPLVHRWEAESAERFTAQVERTPTAPVTPAVINAWAELRAACRARGHALADKVHQGNAWVAATALAYELPLLTGAAIYRGVPELRLLEALDEDQDGIGPPDRKGLLSPR